MLRITLREILLTTAIIAIGMAWWLDHRQYVALAAEHKDLQSRHEFIVKALRDSGIDSIDTKGRMIGR
jgi:hypothetical protein